MYRAIWFRVKIKWKQNKEQIADENTIHVFKFEHRQFIFAKWVSIDTYAIINDDSIHYSDANECAYAIPKMLTFICLFWLTPICFSFSVWIRELPENNSITAANPIWAYFQFHCPFHSYLHRCCCRRRYCSASRAILFSFSLSALARKFMITFGSFHVF